MIEDYMRGFCKVAETRGIDSRELVKFAFKSTPVNEFLMGLIPGSIPGLRIGTAVGSVSGAIAEPSEEQKNGWLNLLPGVAQHRLTNRLKTQVLEQYRKHKSDAAGQLASENIGPLTTAALTAGLGAGIGAVVPSDGDDRKKNIVRGALIGGMTPTVANLVGALIAGIKRRRTEDEQVAHDNDRSNIAKNLLIPGVSMYNKAKRVGRSQGDRDEKEEKKNKSDKKDTQSKNEKKANVLKRILSKSAQAKSQLPEFNQAATDYMGASGQHFIDFRGPSGKRHLRAILNAAKRRGTQHQVDSDMSQLGYSV